MGFGEVSWQSPYLRIGSLSKGDPELGHVPRNSDGWTYHQIVPCLFLSFQPPELSEMNFCCYPFMIRCCKHWNNTKDSTLDDWKLLAKTNRYIWMKSKHTSSERIYLHTCSPETCKTYQRNDHLNWKNC